MAKANIIQNAFTAGELSPLLLGRQDLDKYSKGLAVCFNFLPLVQGGLTRRPGSIFLKTTKFGGTRESRAVPFEFSVTQTYALEFGHLYIRFFTLQGIQTETAQNIEGITQANPGVMTITGHGYSAGDRLHIAPTVGGMHQLWSREVVVSNETANTFELQDIYGLDIDTSGYDAFTSGGTVAKVFEVVSPYSESDLPNLRWTQSADVLYLFHPDYVTRKLSRVAATSWTLTETDFQDGPYGSLNQTSTTLTPSATTGSITITASATTGINGGDGFKLADAGRLIRLLHGSTWGWVEITTAISPTVVNADVKSTLGGVGATTDWRLGLFSDNTGYPVFGTFYEDRLVVAGASGSPQRLDGSRSGDYENFAPSDTDGTVADDHAVSFTLGANSVNNIFWLADDEKALLAGTAGGEWPIRPSTLSEALTPSNISGKRSTTRGSANIAPVNAGEAVLFVQRAQRKLRELSFLFERDGFVSPDMSVLAEHITSPGLVELTYQKEPQSILWGRRSDGVLLGLTYERDQDVIAWHRHQVAGVSDASNTIAKVNSFCSIPAPDGDRDETYLIVERYVNGQKERYMELLSKVWESGDEIEDSFYLDSGVTDVASGGSTEILGLWHMEGETLGVLVDGKRHADLTVTNGKATTTVSAVIRTVGLSYNSDGQTMPIEGGAADGTAQGKIKRISRLGFWLFDTLGLKFGKDSASLTELLSRNWGGQWGVATPLFTGVARENFEGGYDRVGQVYFRADGPFPCNLLALMYRVRTEDDS